MFELTEMQEEIKRLTRQIVEGELLQKIRVEIDGHQENMEVRRALDEKDEYPTDLLRTLSRSGILSVYLPEEYGGMNEGIIGLCLATEEIARICPASSTCYAANALGAIPIMISGTEEQKNKYLSRIASGKEYAAFGLTESGSGSDALSMKTRATLQEDHYILNGEKIFISNAGQADIYSVFAVTNPNRGSRGISGFIVEKGTQGFNFGKKEKKMGLHASETRSLIFSNCKVPKENLIGGREGLGAITILNTLNKSRIGVGAQAVGAAQGAFEAALSYAKQRKQFGKPIFEFQATAHKLARMATLIEAARSLVHKAAWHADHEGSKSTIAKFGAMAKYFASDVAMYVTTEAVQILGGNGYMREYQVEKFMRDVKVFQIYEGTNEIQKEEISRILIKESASLESHANNQEATDLNLLEKGLYTSLEKQKNSELRQAMEHLFATMATKIESARALSERAIQLNNQLLLIMSASYTHKVCTEVYADLFLINSGYYNTKHSENDRISQLI